MKERPILFSGPLVKALLAGAKTQTRRLVNPQPAAPFVDLESCPYGLPGHRLWVRENWAIYHDHAAKVGKEEALRDAREHMPWAHIMFQADANGGHAEEHRVGDRWRPSIHLPRWASRITLEVTEVRVQRLQDISEEDAKAEGVTTESLPGKLNGKPATLYPMTHRQAFTWLWDTINGKRAPWASNPWVWCVSFRRLQ